MKKWMLAVILSAAAVAGAQATCPVIPVPASVEYGEGMLELRTAAVKSGRGLENEAGYLIGKLTAAGIPTGGKGVKITLKTDGKMLANESYRLEIGPNGITITGGDPAGVFYGIVSLLQIVYAEGTSLNHTVIRDSPRFGWRGFLFDEARHFFGKEKVLEILDRMAYYKLNKLQWHLVDSEGWRIEIKKYPLLHTVGGQGCWSDLNSTESKSYTQSEIREIIAYASARHIEIVPEIDMPGHATAANRAYPEYSGGRNSKTHPDFTFNPGKEETYGYLTDILREVAELFPSPYIHLGGDEVSFGIDAWESNPDVRGLMARMKFGKLKDVERYFNSRIGDSLSSLGKKRIGWDELLANGTERSTTITWWRHDKPELLETGLREGYEIILCPRLPCYLDFKQNAEHKWGRIWSSQYFNTIETIYSFPDDIPVITGSGEGMLSNIRGIQGNLWTERVPTFERVDYMVWPRLIAIAESGWSIPEAKDLSDFERRLAYAYDLLDRQGVYYYDYRAPDRHIESPGRDRKK